MLQKPIAAEKLFVPNFRPADKLVWDGSKFVVAPAGQLAYMTHPQTGRQMMVVEPTATNLILNSADFSAGGNPSILTEPVAGIFPGLPGWRLTNQSENTSVSIRRDFATLAGSQTLSAIIRRDLGDMPGLGVRNLTRSNWVGLIRYRWSTDEIINYAAQSGEIVNSGRVFLQDDLILLWLTVSTEYISDAGAGFFYPSFDMPGGSSNLYLMQLEKTPFWTSPIITGNAASTRAGDVLRIDDYDKKVIGADSSGSMFVEYEYPMGELDSNNYYLFAETVDGSSTVRQMIYPAGIANRERAYLYQNGTPSFAGVNNLDAVGVIRKAAASFGADSLAVALNGRGASDVNTTGLIAGINQAAISSSAGLATRPIWVSKIWRDHTVRTAAELEALTS